MSASQKRKARRSSSDSALLLPSNQQLQTAAECSASHEVEEQSLPIRKIKQKGTPVTGVHASSGPAISAQATPSEYLQEMQVSNPAMVSHGAAAMQPAAPPVGCVHFLTSIVGRRFRTNITCTKHTQVVLVRQPDNPRDSNAIQVMDSARQAILGYLPREIAQHLSALLDAGSVQVSATVDEPKSVAAAVPILLEVCGSVSLCSCATWYAQAFDLRVFAISGWPVGHVTKMWLADITSCQLPGQHIRN